MLESPCITRALKDVNNRSDAASRNEHSMRAYLAIRTWMCRTCVICDRCTRFACLASAEVIAHGYVIGVPNTPGDCQDSASCARYQRATEGKPRRGRTNAELPWISIWTVFHEQALLMPRVLAEAHVSRAQRARRTHPTVRHARGVQGATREHWQAKDGALEFVL